MTSSPLDRSVRATLGALVLAALVGGCQFDGAHDPANELPFGVIDLPLADAVVRAGPLPVAGWALDDDGIAEIRVYFDGRFKGRTACSVPRTDVVKAFPRYAGVTDLHGWNLRIDVPAEYGRHSIIAQAVDRRGATRDLGQVSITVVK
jgi:Bacterial Ig domain